MGRVTDEGRARISAARRRLSEQTANARFWSRVRKGPDCWIWTGSRLPAGYGRFLVGGKGVYAHRWSFVLAFGAIPDGLYVCHRCDNPQCVRPEHLFAGTALDNARDAKSKGRLTPSDRRSELSRGQNNGRAKLTEEAVSAAKRMRADGVSYARIGVIFGVQRAAARKACVGLTWRANVRG